MANKTTVTLDVQLDSEATAPQRVKVGLAEFIALEREYDLDLEDESALKLYHLAYLAYRAMRKSGVGVPEDQDFDSFAERLISIEEVESATPTEPRPE